MILIPKYKDAFQMSGALSLILTDTTNDKIKQEMYVPNLVVNSGKQHIALRMNGTLLTSTVNCMSHMGLGTDNATVEAVTQTALVAEVSTTNPTGASGYARAATTSTNPSSATNNTIQFFATFAAGNPTLATSGVLIKEAGIFNQLALGGVMLCRTVFPVVTKMPNDSLSITWTITIN